MKQIIKILTVLMIVVTLAACATTPQDDGYHTRLGASLGAGLGAIGGQLAGGSTEATLIGAAIGSLFGAIVGSGVDQERQAAEEAAVMCRERDDRNVDGGYTGGRRGRTDCRKGTDPAWEGETLLSGRVKEAREDDDVSEKRYR